MSEEVLNRFREAVHDLLYQSESDEPFEVWHWKDTSHIDPLSKVSALSKGKAGAVIKTISLDEFFKNLIEEKKWHGEEEKAVVKKYKELKAQIVNNLKQVQVFRAGQIEVDIWIIGRNQARDLMAIKTKAVET